MSDHKEKSDQNLRCPHCDGLISKCPHLLFESTPVHKNCFVEWVKTVYPYDCPKCNATGMIVTKWKEEKECCRVGKPQYGGFGPFAFCEYCPDIKTHKLPQTKITCDLCNGHSRLKKEAVPIIETKVVGWKCDT